MSILDEHIKPHISVDLNNPWFKDMGFIPVNLDPYGRIHAMHKVLTRYHEMRIIIDENGNGIIKYLNLSQSFVHITADVYEHVNFETFQSAILKAIQEHDNFEGPFYRDETQPHKSKIRRFLERWLGFAFRSKRT